MNITARDNNIYIDGVEDFLLSQTLECGQCFHFIKLEEECYELAAFGRLLRVKQEDRTLIFYNTTKEEYENLWENYFDLRRDYAQIKRELLAIDDTLRPAIEAMWGVRILNQDFFETLISFIISQNQQIPRIKNIVAAISYNYGNRLSDTLSAFPNVEKILAAGVEGIKACKAGFRSPYIIDACEKYKDGTINEADLMSMSYEECIDCLKQIKGVGDKVANCVALFSLGKRSAFPVDVWIKRIMESLYFGREATISEIQKLAAERFGSYGGYAQQYLFYFGKTNEIGKNSKK